ncbi:MAG: hypothetical protein HY702_05430 [Gemmatimonadetes bacterium]|nr:hypothetical protein [Gemmatimonadota bacterium]
MATDVALALTTARTGRITIRFYRWAPACLSFGRNQPAAGRYDVARLAALRVDVVRRPTGGRAVLHDDEVTYALAFPARALGGPRSAFLALHAALARGLRSLGVDAHAVAAERAGAPRVPLAGPCFAQPAPGEIVVHGRKLVGSAQARIGGALLQHGSILLSGSQQRAAESEGSGAPAQFAAEPSTATLEECLGHRPRWDDVVPELACAFGLTLGLARVPDALDAVERALVSEQVARVRDPAWTWRR